MTKNKIKYLQGVPTSLEYAKYNVLKLRKVCEQSELRLQKVPIKRGKIVISIMLLGQNSKLPPFFIGSKFEFPFLLGQNSKLPLLFKILNLPPFYWVKNYPFLLGQYFVSVICFACKVF